MPAETSVIPLGPTAAPMINNEVSEQSEAPTEANRLPNQHPVWQRTLTASRNVMELQHPGFLCAWSCVVDLHTICAVYLTQSARVYLFLAQPYMAYWTQLSAGDRRDYFGSAGVVIGIMGALDW